MKWSELTAGQRDDLVARHILGCQTHAYNGGIICNCYDAPHREPGRSLNAVPFLADYTSDWRAMEQVTKAMEMEGYTVSMSIYPNGEKYASALKRYRSCNCLRDRPLPELVAYVCLKALGVDVEE